MKSFCVENRAGERAQRALGIFERVLRERASLRVEEGGASHTDLILALDAGIAPESYAISGEFGEALTVTGGDELGLLYGIGRLLHEGQFGNGEFHPGGWRGEAVPEGAVRGMFFAFHNNWYDNAPTEEVLRYIEDLALWGLNSLLFHLHKYQEKTDDDTGLGRTHRIMKHARGLGIKVGLLSELNIAHDDAPQEILAQEFPDTVPVRRGFQKYFICPSTPGGYSYLSKQLSDYLDDYAEVGLDYVVAFPYDAGGCGCEGCWPWGARGYVKMAKEYSRLAREKHPGAKFVLGTWCFDVREESDGEYEGLEAVLAEDASWVDFIMGDSHEDFPEYLMRPGALAGLPIVNFAEISMWGRFPWGGSGANPYPQRLQHLWDQSAEIVCGGFPYSEGNFEDINKVVTLGFFWDSQTTAAESVRSYVLYEFGKEAVEEIERAIYLMERTLHQQERSVDDVRLVYELILDADARLTPTVRNSWRWQILYWRAVIDFERATHDNSPTQRCDDAYEKLIDIFHLREGWRAVTPPARSYLERVAPAALETVIPGSTPELATSLT